MVQKYKFWRGKNTLLQSKEHPKQKDLNVFTFCWLPYGRELLITRNCSFIRKVCKLNKPLLSEVDASALGDRIIT